MSTPRRRSIFTSPLGGTLFMVVPAAGLIALAFAIARGRVDHTLSMFGQKQGLFVLAFFVLEVVLLLALAGVTFRRARRPAAADERRPSATWAALPLLAALGLLGFVGLVVRHGQLLQQSETNADKLAALSGADFSAPVPPPALAVDWPQWRGPRRDGIALTSGLLADWNATPPKLVWSKPIKGGYSSLAIVDGRVYAMDRDHDRERVLCYDAETGNELWNYSYEADYSRVEYEAGPRATPTVHDGRVYTVGATGIMHCLEAVPASGQPKVLWQHDLVREFDAQAPRWGVACSPLIEGDLVIVQPGGVKGSVAAFSRLTGDLVWSSLTDESGYSSPMAGTLGGVRQIICLTAKGLAGLHPKDGHELWYYRWVTRFGGNIATPILAGNYVFISTGYDKGCALLEITPEGQGVAARPVYVRLRDELMQNHHSTCVLHDGFLYGHDSGSGAWKCIDLRTATERWRSESLAKGCAIFADDNLILLTQDGLLALVEATPEGYRQKGSLQVFEKPKNHDAWALPALAQGRLYLRDGKQLVCYDLRK